MKVLLLNLLFFVTFLSASSVVLECPPNAALNGVNSTQTFFKGDTSPICNDLKEELCQSFPPVTSVESVSDAYNETSDSYYDILSVGCESKDNIIKSASINVYNGRPTSLTVECCQLTDSFPVLDQFERDSSDSGNSNANCGEGGAVQKMKLVYPGNGASTKVVLSCATIKKQQSAQTTQSPGALTSSGQPQTTPNP